MSPKKKGPVAVRFSVSPEAQRKMLEGAIARRAEQANRSHSANRPINLPKQSAKKKPAKKRKAVPKAKKPAKPKPKTKPAAPRVKPAPVVVRSIEDVVGASIRTSDLKNKEELFRRSASFIRSIERELVNLKITDHQERMEKAMELMKFYLSKGRM